VQRDLDTLDPSILEARQDRRCEVEPGSWRRNRAARLRVDGLVSLAIRERVATLDIRGSGM